MPNVLYDALFAPARDSDRTFLWDAHGREMSYGAFHALAARQANVLVSAGLVVGDRLPCKWKRRRKHSRSMPPVSCQVLSFCR